MDFRSQLSAFQKKPQEDSNRGSSAGGSNDNRDRGGRGYSYSNDNSSNYYNNRHGSPNRGGDRRRHRPRDWGQSSNYNHGPPTARRRYNPPHYGSTGHSHGYGHGPPNLDGLSELRNLGYRIPRGFPPAPKPDEKARQPKHLALLAITIDDLPFEEIWKAWCNAIASSDQDGIGEYFVSVVCHAKFPEKVTSEWLRKRLLTFPPKQGRGNSYMDPVFLSRTPEWGSVEITRAMLDLLQQGLKIGNTDAPKYEDKRFCPSRFLVQSPDSFDGSIESIPPVDTFLYISESCVPVVTSREFFTRVAECGVTTSWLNARHRTESDTPKNKYEDDQFAGINRRIPGQYRWKGDQWVLLSRPHAASIIGMDRPFKPTKHQLWQSFRHINASDEMFFPTALALLGDLRYTKDGYDTQKGRSRDEEASSAQSGEGSSSGVSTFSPSPKSGGPLHHMNKESGGEDAGNSSFPPPKNETIVLKPVTYTDWTEGMKNPATYSKGLNDLRKISKIARDMGCLVARKFVTHIRIPGVPDAEQKITGKISPEEWASVIKELQNIEGLEKQKKSQQQVEESVPDGPPEAPSLASPNPEDTATSTSDHIKESSTIGEPISDPTEVKNDTHQEEDNDEGETQLE